MIVIGGKLSGFIGKLLMSLLQILFTVWIAVTASFFALALVPGDPVEIRLGPLASISEAQKTQLRSQLGLDLPILQQYFLHLKSLITGDLGYSFNQHLKVSEIIARQFGHTVQLTCAALLFAGLLTLIAQVLKRARTQWQRKHALRQGVFDLVSVLATATPNYWLGYLLLLVFAVKLRWFPAGGVAGIESLILPALALAIPVAAIIGQVLDAELNAQESSAFALSSRARGMSRLEFAAKHGLRHTLPAVGPVVVNITGAVLGGAVLTETVFARPGLGKVALDAVIARDMPVVLGLVALSALFFAVLGRLLELFLALVDPRASAE